MRLLYLLHFMTLLHLLRLLQLMTSLYGLRLLHCCTAAVKAGAGLLFCGQLSRGLCTIALSVACAGLTCGALMRTKGRPACVLHDVAH
jgi:hypothetical protein